jgi:hypothetical protein
LVWRRTRTATADEPDPACPRHRGHRHVSVGVHRGYSGFCRGQEVVVMTAAEVIEQAHRSAGGTWWSGAHDHAAVANHVLDVLKAARYAVVELPTGTLLGGEVQEFPAFVHLWRTPAPRCITFHEHDRLCTVMEARSLAAALLAAADAAEAGAE